MAIFEKAETKHTKPKYIKQTYKAQKIPMDLKVSGNKKLFEEILGRIKSQSYDYSRIKDKNLYTSLFFDVENPSNIFVPLFNYFDDTVNWLRTDIYNPIQLTQKYKFYGAYKNILNSEQIYELFESGKIKNLVLTSNPNYKYNQDFNIQIAVEVLYKKRIFFLIKLVIDNQHKYTTIPIESALRVRGDNIFRTDLHGNKLDSQIIEDNKRYKIISFDTSNIDFQNL